MARILCIHGIAQQLEGPEILAGQWSPAIRDGMRAAGADESQLALAQSIDVTFYGDLFRGRKKGASSAPLVLADIGEGLESDLLLAWDEQSREAGVSGSEQGSKKGGRAPRSIQVVAKALLELRFFAALADRTLVGPLRQVRWYLTEPETRASARGRFLDALSADTRLVIAHSLGSVVAYESLCGEGLPAKPALITLGSPLGLPNLIFDRLEPGPIAGVGRWPGGVRSWTNISAPNDVVASVKRLAPLFEGEIDDITVANEARAHDVRPYLTASATGRAVLKALDAA